MTDDIKPIIIDAISGDLGQIHMDYSRPSPKYDAFEVLRKRMQRLGTSVSKNTIRDAVKELEAQKVVKVGHNIEGHVYMIRPADKPKSKQSMKPGPKAGSVTSTGMSKAELIRRYMWWSLSEMGGQINENHHGGNAGKTLKEAAEEHGAEFKNSTDLAVAMTALIRAEIVQGVKDPSTNRFKVIRMLKEPDVPCPFKIESQQQLAVVSPTDAPVQQLNAITVPAEGSLINGQRNWPISQRLQLIKELSDSVNEDLALVGTMFQSPAQ